MRALTGIPPGIVVATGLDAAETVVVGGVDGVEGAGADAAGLDFERIGREWWSSLVQIIAPATTTSAAIRTRRP